MVSSEYLLLIQMPNNDNLICCTLSEFKDSYLSDYLSGHYILRNGTMCYFNENIEFAYLNTEYKDISNRLLSYGLKGVSAYYVYLDVLLRNNEITKAEHAAYKRWLNDRC